MSVTVHHGDCLDVLRGMGEASVDSVVTDPPAGISFMNREWDHHKGGRDAWVAWMAEVAAECLRVAKPGAHALVWALPRTSHWTATAWENAGWEVRDRVSHLFGTGFPKSLDVSKAIDRMRIEDQAPTRAVCRFIRAAMDAKGLKSRHLAGHFGDCHPRLIDHWAARDSDSQPAVPTWDQWLALKPLLGLNNEMNAEVWRLNGRKGQPGDAWAEREVVGATAVAIDKWTAEGRRRTEAGDSGQYKVPITAPATDAARQWQGWGTALKPAVEDWWLLRKPLACATVAAQVLATGTGGLHIDACRIPSSAGQRPNEGGEWESDENLCASCAAPADSREKPSTPATGASTATRLAGQTLSARGALLPRDIDKPDIGCFAGMRADDTSSNSSIAECGKPPTAPYRQGTKSTTSTGTRATTGSRTCNACGAPITPSNIANTTRKKNGARPTPQPSAGNGSGSASIPLGSSGSEPEASSRTGASVRPPARWPSNICHDGSPEVLAAFAAFGERKSGELHPWHDAKPSANGSMSGGNYAGRIKQSFGGDAGSAARFFYSAKASKAERAGSRHPTVKPLALMRWLCRLVTPPGGVVLDCFAGTGVTGEAAMLEGFGAVLVEREAEHVRDIRRRLGRARGDDTPLLSETAA